MFATVVVGMIAGADGDALGAGSSSLFSLLSLLAVTMQEIASAGVENESVELDLNRFDLGAASPGLASDGLPKMDAPLGFRYPKPVASITTPDGVFKVGVARLGCCPNGDEPETLVDTSAVGVD